MLFKTIGILAALLTSIGFVPQIVKTFMLKETKDISLIMLLIIASGTFLWIIYGWSIGDPIVTGANFITCSTTVTLIIMKKLYNGDHK
jgi:MtN3 and saliva related transmembrane protein